MSNNKNFQPETEILPGVKIVDQINLSNIKKPAKKATDQTPAKPAKKEPKYLLDADPLFQTVGQAMHRQLGFVYVDEQGNLKSTKKK